MSLEVSAPQKAVLERDLGALPRESATGPIEGGTELPSLFYHPNSAARVLALVVSAAYDALNGRQPNSERKIDRAIEVFTLVADDSAGRSLLAKLKELLTSDVGGFLRCIHGEVAPYLGDRMDSAMRGPAPKPVPTAQPHALEAGEQARERLSAPRPPPMPRQPRYEEPPAEAPAPEPEAAEPAEAEAEAEAAPAPVAHVEPVDPYEAGAGRHRHGPSDDEAAAAAAAALAAMEAPYEDVVSDAQRRFDPDRDLEPEEARGGNGRRGDRDRGGRRGGRSLEGLERPKPDQVRPQGQTQAQAQGERRPRVEEGEAGPEAREAGPMQARPDVRAARSCEDAELAEAILDVARQALRMAREQGLGGRLRVELSVARGEGGGPPRERGEGRGDGRGRRRRRRNPRSPDE